MNFLKKLKINTELIASGTFSPGQKLSITGNPKARKCQLMLGAYQKCPCLKT